MKTFDQPDRLHRLIKESLDSGVVSSLEEAVRLFQQYRVVLSISKMDSLCESHQATLLTAVAIGRRVFHGGVLVCLEENSPLLPLLPLASTLREAIIELGGEIVAELPSGDVPHIVIGGTTRPRHRQFEIRTIVSGWCGGILPIDHEEVAAEVPIALTAMLAAGFAINEAFLYVRRELISAGRRSVGLSLWNPSIDCDWLNSSGNSPALSLLPSRLWMLGLGHLGQAYLWALGLLPYAKQGGLELVLQDIDIITPSTESTSILSDSSVVGRKKTRVLAEWAERRGFSTAIHERHFGVGFCRQDDEPVTLLCGLDNALGRRALDGAGFEFVVEAGLGRGYRDFRTIRLHTLPASRSAAQIWPHRSDVEANINSPAYQRMLQDGVVDKCGMTLLAGKGVGAPFVGAIAAALAIAEVLRLLHGGSSIQLIDLDLQFPEYRDVILQDRDFSRINPGFSKAAA